MARFIMSTDEIHPVVHIDPNLFKQFFCLNQTQAALKVWRPISTCGG